MLVIHGLTYPSHVNNTHIVLIMEVKSLTSMVKFRHISFSNVLYKLVTKTLECGDVKSECFCSWPSDKE